MPVTKSLASQRMGERVVRARAMDISSVMDLKRRCSMETSTLSMVTWLMA